MVSFILLLIGLNGNAQAPFEPQRIDVTVNKTCNLVFPSMIKSVDRGSRDILAQKAKQVENVLQVKAAGRDFRETNLTVITTDGTIHSFLVNYAESPDQLNWFITGQQPTKEVQFDRTVDENALAIVSRKILVNNKKLCTKAVSRYGVGLSLYGIYVKHDAMFYHVHLNNRTNIDYDIESLRFYVIDKEKAKRTASQEIDIVPLNLLGKVDQVAGNAEADIVFALEKFTIPDAKRLVIEMFERHGGRHLKLSIRNMSIVKAQLVPGD